MHDIALFQFCVELLTMLDEGNRGIERFNDAQHGDARGDSIRPGELFLSRR